MSEQRLNLAVTDELVRRMIALEGNEDFAALMKLMQSRAEGLAMWSSIVEHEVRVRWAQGRVAEMMDWLRLWHGRREFKRALEAQAAAKEGL